MAGSSDKETGAGRTAGQIGLSEAIAALRGHYGPRLQAGKEEGRDLMVQALEEDAGISANEARKLVDALEQAGSIFYTGGGGDLRPIPTPQQMTGETITRQSQ